ncbi:MAG: hypothetical protein ACLR8L_00195 [Oscillospiraceae bacterium]
MKITLDLPDGTICGFFCGVEHTGSGLQLHPISSAQTIWPMGKRSSCRGNAMTIEFTVPYPARKSAWTKRYGLNAYWAGKNHHVRAADARDLEAFSAAVPETTGRSGSAV